MRNRNGGFQVVRWGMSAGLDLCLLTGFPIVVSHERRFEYLYQAAEHHRMGVSWVFDVRSATATTHQYSTPTQKADRGAYLLSSIVLLIGLLRRVNLDQRYTGGIVFAADDGRRAHAIVSDSGDS
jgi:hypothetical protein